MKENRLKTRGQVSDIDKLVSRNMKRLRVSKKVKQQELAEFLGVTFQQIQKYENAKNRISAGKLFKIARFLEVTPNDMYKEGSIENCSEMMFLEIPKHSYNALLLR